MQKADKQYRHPQHKIEAIAHCIMSDVLSFYEIEEGHRKFAEWKSGRKKRGRKTK